MPQPRQKPDPQAEQLGQSETLGLQVRAAPVASVNDDERTVDLVWSTGAPVRRYSWTRDEYYDEVLDLDSGAVDLSRLNAGAPLLNTHGTWDLSDVVGVIETAALKGGQGVATVRFSDREDVEPIWQDVRNKIIRNVSVGYQVRKYEITREEGKVPIYRAVDWTPFEVSLVPVPADPGAQVREGKAVETPCLYVEVRAEPETPEESNMPEENTAPAGNAPAEQTRAIEPAATAAPAAQPPVVETRTAPATPAAPAIDEAAIRKAAGEAERARISAIRTLAAQHRMDEDFVRQHIDGGTDVQTVGNAVLDALASRQPETSNIRVDADEGEKLREAMTEALLHRSGYVAELKLGRDFRGLSLLEMGTFMLERAGEKTRGLSKMERAGMVLGLNVRSGGMMSTSDFPNILAAVANKTLRQAYDAAPQTFKPFTRRVTVTDFKPVNRLQLSGAPAFEKVNESGEFKRGAMSEGKESYQIATYGKIVAVTRQVIVNDDLDAFTRLPALFGRAAADFESDTVWAVITANAAMSDGTTLFHANHGNLAGTAAAPSVTSLGKGREAMRKQKGLEGRYINVMAKFIMVPPELETVVDQLRASIFATKATDVTPEYVRNLTPISEPRLSDASATAWYLAADPAQIDTIEYAYLDGQEGVYMESRVGFDVDGLELKARTDFGAKAIDWRGLFKNSGS